MADNTSYVTGLFSDRDSAALAYQRALDRGYQQADIHVVMSDEARARHFGRTSADSTPLDNKVVEGAGLGVGIGGAVGAIAAAVAAVGSGIVVPGLGLVAAGPIAVAFGAGTGGAVGGLLGALIGWNIPEDRLKEYESGIQQGGILLGVRPRHADDALHLEEQWRSANGTQVYR